MLFRSTSYRAKGFTLIEIMVVVAIIGILAAIAYPNYTEYVRRGKRADAQTQLQQLAQFMQRYYSTNDRYTAAAGTTTTEAAANAPAVPAGLAQSPANGTAAYNLTILARDNPPTFTLQATPTGSMAGDKCNVLTLNSSGVKNIENPTSGTTVADCWR